MKPLYFTCLLTLLLPFGAVGQSEILDAIQLRKFLKPIQNGKTIAQLSGNPEDQEAYLTVLLKYTDEPNALEPDQVVQDAFFGNPFLSDKQGVVKILLPDTYHSAGRMFETNKNLQENIPAAQSAQGGMFVSNLADGLANFLVKRTKQELTIAFFRDFQDKIKSNPYLNQLFPETSVLLAVIGNEIYQYNAFLGSLRESYARDMKMLPTHLQQGLEQFGWLDGRPTLKIVSTDVLGLSQLLVDGSKPVDLIQYLGTTATIQQPSSWEPLNDPQQKLISNVAASFRMLSILSESLRDTSGWVPRAVAEKNLGDPLTLNLYLALLYQKSASILFSNERSMHQGLQANADSNSTINRLREQTMRFVAYGQSLRQSVDMIAKKGKSDSIGYEAYYQFFSNFFALMQSGLEFRRIILPDPACDSMETNFMSGLQRLNNLNLNVRQKEYTLAITDVVVLLDLFIGPEKFNDKTRSTFMKYGMFVASIAQADSPEAMEQAIELFALPPGSSSMKKHARLSFSLNAFTGLAYGTETLQKQGKANTIAVAAPVGLALNFGLGGRRGSMSFFTSVIDIGAVTAYRFNDNNTEDLPALEWSNILAPGAFAVYGFGLDIPISVGFGAQIGPNLRKIDAGGSLNIENDRGWRMLGFVAVDIPIVHFYTKK